MKLTAEELRALAGMLRATREHELTCDECLPELARLAEAGEPTEVPELVGEHLRLCAECREDLALLRKALGDGASPGHGDTGSATA